MCGFRVGQPANQHACTWDKIDTKPPLSSLCSLSVNIFCILTPLTDGFKAECLHLCVHFFYSCKIKSVPLHIISELWWKKHFQNQPFIMSEQETETAHVALWRTWSLFWLFTLCAQSGVNHTQTWGEGRAYKDQLNSFKWKLKVY